MVIKAPQLKKILKNPIKAAELANLVYITEKRLTIKRHRHGKGFYYTEADKKIKTKKDIKRFQSLVIPPAWEEVLITPVLNGHLQVVGRDEKNRKQYRYHPHWNQIRNMTKFFKMAAFGNVLPEIRKQVGLDLKLGKMTKRKCLALVVRLMEETHIRIGNDYYARNNKSYGLSTLRTKHVAIHKNKMKFNFVGKKGKAHSITVQNKKLQKLVMQCEEIPGWELFQYYDEDGDHHRIDSGMVNDYIHEISGDLFSAKDFRTWAASKIFFETLAVLEKPETETQKKKNIITAYDAAAEGLGNTRTVCRKYYVHPALVENYEAGKLDPFFDEMNAKDIGTEYMSNSEMVLLKIIAGFEIDFEASED
ncbi:DNA topoisomerase IB [Aequorivita echinoideorum]|uniref:DNA topoisomerase n=1 Tax=Aequorivita echinoideorum TaxID=1549647 RepID=A0ABS5S7R4_9FLAO|nr:DNA topoisomerase IB [Aequorivita echinoideorum]MBT0607900.1 DNA topoisomerase IB [Aequorivita echinoideorum]